MFPWTLKGKNEKFAIFSDMILWDHALKGNIRECSFSARCFLKKSMNQ